jgi:hypothetical protein
MPKRTVCVALMILAAAVAAAPVRAGIYYKSVSRTEAQGAAAADTTVQGWVDGEKAKIEFSASGNPMTPAGAYLLTQDGGRTVLLVNPEEKTYATWDLEAMLGVVGGVMKGMGPLLKFEVSQPRVEKLAEEDGGSLVGLPTRHYRYRTSYSMQVKVFGMGQENAVVTEQDIWATSQLQDAALGVWLRTGPPKTGNDQLDSLIAAEMGKVTGFPLKSITVSTSTGKRGQKTTTRSVMEVKELRRADVPAATFQLPAGYTETQLLPTMPQ